jgi:hypothetical protein
VGTSREHNVIGSVGRLTMAITESRAGEVVVGIRGGTEVFTARADAPLDKNAKVLVVEQISARSVQVVPLL